MGIATRSVTWTGGLLLMLGSVVTAAPDEGHVLHAFRSGVTLEEEHWWFDPSSIETVGDLDGDGHADVIVGFPGRAPDGHIGFVRVYSGLDGAILHQFEPLDGELDFGRAVASAGDADADGVPDLLVGAAGHVWVYSGKDGHVLVQLESTDYEFGSDVSTAGDLNGDGWDDIIVGESVYSGTTGTGVVRAYSVRDGVAEILAGTLSCCGGDSYVRIWSGATGELIRHVPVAKARMVSGMEDVDGDDVHDLTVWMSVHSGATGDVIKTFGAGDYERPIRAAGDVDGDGLPDIVRMRYIPGLLPKRIQVESVVPTATVGSVESTGEGCDPGALLPLNPTLQVTGRPEGGGAIAISLVGAEPGGLGFLMLGPPGEQALPSGCLLLIAPPFDVFPLPVSGTFWGWSSQTVRPLPDDIALVLPEVHMQAATLDPPLYLGYSLSNRVRVTFDL